jgi:cephalosporin hydroxylase
MVILDSDHSKKHVDEELKIYSNLVSRDCYLIVEDSNVNGHPVLPDHGPGPMEAIDEFLQKDNRFIIDDGKEKFYMTFNLRGYLKRVK